MLRRQFLELGGVVAIASCLPSVRRSLPMHSRPLLTLRLATAPTQELGKRITFPVTGGTFEGDRLRGAVLPGGGDWVIVRPDGVLELDLRVTLQTDDGALVHMTFEGVRAGEYFRTTPRFETSDPRYAYLNRLLALGVGEIRAEGPVHVIEEIL